MQSLICCSDLIKLWVAKIKGGWIKQQSSRKIGEFCGLFFAKEQRKGLKGKPDENLLIDFFAVCWVGAGRDAPTASFYA